MQTQSAHAPGETKESFTSSSDLIADFTFSLKLNGEVQKLNSPFLRYLQGSPEDFHNRPFNSLIEPEDRSKIYEALGRCLSETRAFAEYVGVKSGPTTKHFDFSFFLQVSKKGATGIYGIAQPAKLKQQKPENRTVISCTEASEKKSDCLANSRSSLFISRVVEFAEAVGRTPSEGIPLGIWIANRRGNLVYASAAFLRVIGSRTLDDICVGGAGLLPLPEKLQVLEKWKSSVQNGSGWRHDFNVVDSSGHLHEIRAIGYPVATDPDHPATYWAGIHLDVTERREIELNSNLEQRLLDILDRITDGFAAVDRSWTILYCNREVERITGKPRSQLLGRNLWEACPQYVGTKVYRKYHHAMDTNEPTTFLEYLPPFNAWFETSIYPSAAGLSIYFRDVTEKKNIEEQMRCTLDKLRMAGKDLARTNSELEQFAAVAAHDLKEPLRMISIFVKLLDRKFRGQNDPETNQYVEYVTGATHRLSGLVDDLLSFCQTRRTLPEKLEEIDTEVCLRQALSDLTFLIQESNAEITHTRLPKLKGNPHQITHVFQNLLSNAIKFRDPSRRCRIEIDVEEGALDYVFRVADNGIGFDMMHSEKIFGIFKKLHNRDEYAGTGIGLSICKKIIENHGGRIWTESQTQRGTTFFFTLPKNLSLPGEIVPSELPLEAHSHEQ